MSTNKINFEKEIMSRVASGKIAMKPRWYFAIGSIFILFGIIAATVVAMFMINLTIFLIKKQGPGYGKLAMMFENFSFWIPILAIVGIGVGILLLRKYDFSYKKNFALVVIVFISSIIVAGFIIDQLGLNDSWSRRGPMKRFYQQIENQTDLPTNVPGRNYKK